MYLPGQAEHYLSVGLSAARVLGAALQAKPTPSVGSVLDFPCGYGRVLRFLKAMFPEASVTGAEIDADALRFCRRVFGIDAIRSGPDFRGIAMPRRFDVIWCGSLVTHFDERSTTALLSMFFEWLDESGVCVLTTHGRLSAEWIRSGSVTYGLPTAAQRTVLAQYDGDGYGYADLD